MSKINTFIEKCNINNIVKILILLIILFIIYRLFTNNIKEKSNTYLTKEKNSNFIEGFQALSYNNYGNVLTLKKSTNTPIYSNNQCILELDTIYRIDSLILKFNANTDKNNIITTFDYKNINDITIQYLDGNGNMRNLKSYGMNNSNFSDNIIGGGYTNDLYTLDITNITDENDLSIYTSKLIITIGDSSNKIADYKDTNNIGYIKEYCIFGGERNLLSKNEYDIIANNLNKYEINNGTPVIDNINNKNTITFGNINNGDNLKIYSLKLNILQSSTSTDNIPSESPFDISIKYNNSLYPSNDFTVKQNYKVRSDNTKLNDNSVFMFLVEPIIANKLIFTVQNSRAYNLNISSISINGKDPDDNDIKDYKRNVNLVLNKSSNDESNICPNIDTLIEKQTKTQQICDNLEYQDKVKSEKIRLERNKQYLLKLKNQQEQIDELNNVIQDLETKRTTKDTTADQIRVLQYQKQKSDASTIRDLANQRLESQDKNKLFMDVNLNYT
jgi:hypothetical protein